MPPDYAKQLESVRSRGNTKLPAPPSSFNSQGIPRGSFMTNKGKKSLGLENETEGGWNVFGENVVKGSRDVASSFLTFFGNTKASAYMDAGTQSNRDYDVKNIRTDGMLSFLDSTKDWVAQSVGQSVTDIGGAIAAGAITGGVGAAPMLGTSAFSFMRMSGANYRMVRDWRPDASISDSKTMAYTMGILQAAVEQIGGMEALGASKLLKGKNIDGIAGKMLEKAKRDGTLTGIQKALTSSKNRVVSIGKGALAETFEEQLQGGVEVIAGSTWGDQEYSSEDLLEKLIYEPLRALPSGGIMGGVFHTAKTTGESAVGAKPVGDQDKAAMFSDLDENGNFVLDQALMESDDAAFTELEKQLGNALGDDAAIAADQIKSQAYALSFAAQVNYGEDVKPSDLIKTLRLAYEEKAVSPQIVKGIDAIRQDDTITQDEKGRRILDYVSENLGTESNLYKTLGTIGRYVEASEIRSITGDILSTLERQVPKMNDEEYESWRSDISGRLSEMLGMVGEDAVLPEPETPAPVSWDDMGSTLSSSDIARLFVEQSVIDIAGTDYVVNVTSTGLHFTEKGEYDGVMSDLIEAKINEIAPLVNVTDVDDGLKMLAEEKVLYDMAYGRINVGAVIAMFNNREGGEVEAPGSINEQTAGVRQGLLDQRNKYRTELAEEKMKVDAEYQKLRTRLEAEQAIEKKRAKVEADWDADKRSKAARERQATRDEIKSIMEEYAAKNEFQDSVEDGTRAAELQNLISALDLKIEEQEAQQKAAPVEKKRKKSAAKATETAETTGDTFVETTVPVEEQIAKIADTGKKAKKQLQKLKEESNRQAAIAAVDEDVSVEEVVDGDTDTRSQTEKLMEILDEGELNTDAQPDITLTTVSRGTKGSKIVIREEDGKVTYVLKNKDGKTVKEFDSQEEIEAVVDDEKFKDYKKPKVETFKKPLPKGDVVKKSKFKKGSESHHKAVSKRAKKLMDKRDKILADLKAGKKGVTRVDAIEAINKVAELYKKEGILKSYNEGDQLVEYNAEETLLREEMGVNPDNEYDYGGALFFTGEFGQPIGEMSVEDAIRYGNDLGLVHVGYSPESGWHEFHDVANEVSFTVMANQSVEQAQAEAMTALKEANAAMGISTQEGSGIRNTSESAIKGMYVPAERVMILFKGAGIETVMHEFAHHAKSILPIEMQSDILEVFNKSYGQDTGVWTTEAEEWFANSFTKWIVNKEPPFLSGDAKGRAAFEYAKRMVMSVYKGYPLSTITAQSFDEMFGDMQTQEVVLGAKQAMDTMIYLDPPTMGQVSALINGRSGSRFERKSADAVAPAEGDIDASALYDSQIANGESVPEFTKQERKTIFGQLHAIFGDHKLLKEFASSVYGYDGSLADISDTDLRNLLNTAKAGHITENTQVNEQANDDGNKLIEAAKASGEKKQTMEILESDSHAMRLLKGAAIKMRPLGRAVTNLVTSWESMMKIMDDMSDTGVWHNLISAPLHAARDMRSKYTKQNLDFMHGLVKKAGINMNKIQNKKVFLNGKQYTQGAVASLATISRMRPQDVESFLASNFPESIDEGRALLKSANDFALANPDVEQFIQVLHDTYTNIYDDLSKVYKDVTGKDMGKIEWYMPFIRSNEWDDLDPVLSKLTQINPEAAEHYRSETGRMKERQGGDGGKIFINDPLGMAYRYVEQASTYIAMAPTVQQVSATLKSQGAKQALKWKFGEADGKAVNSAFMGRILNELVLGELFYDARTKAMSESEAIFKKWRTNFTVFALAGNIGTSVKQIVSAPLGIAKSGAILEVSVRAAGQAIAIMPRAIANSMYNTARFLSGATIGDDYRHVLAGTNVYEQWGRYSNTLLNRHGNPETGESQPNSMSGFGGIEIGGVPLGEAMMAGISAVDAVTVGVIWQSTFDTWVRINKDSKGMSEEDAAQAAADKANAVIRDTQPPSLPQDRNLLQRGNEFTRGLFMFTGASMRQYEVFATDIMGKSFKALQGVKSKGITSLTDVLFKGEDVGAGNAVQMQSGVLAQMGMGFVLPAILFGILSRRRKPTEEELMADILSYPVAALPMMKTLIGIAVGVDGEIDGEASTYYQSVLETYGKSFKAFASGVYGDDWSPRNIEEALDGLALAIGAPRQISRLVSAAFADALGEGDFADQMRENFIEPYDEPTLLND